MICDNLPFVRQKALLAASLAGLLACQNSPDGQDSQWTGVTTNPTTPGSTSTTSTSGESSSTSTSISTSTTTSTGAGTTLEPPPDMPGFDTLEPVPEGCEKIDLLFVLNNRGSNLLADQDWLREEAELQAARMLGLVDALTAEAANYDLHVMVAPQKPGFTTTADKWCMPGCDPVSMPCDVVPEYVCVEDSWEECDWALGSGKNFPRGVGASNALCPTTEGRRFAQSQDATFPEAVDCLLRVGHSGTGQEYPALTPIAALKPEMVTEGGCNAGFLRDDAMLVVVMVVNGDEGSPGTPEEWAQELLAVKGGYGDGIVFVAITESVGPECGDSERIRLFAEAMPNRVLGCMSAEDYTPIVLEAIDKIDAVCDKFIPPG